jgi:hypothetical protein
MRRTLMVDGGSNDSGSSLGFGEVDGGGSLHLHHRLALVQLGHLGVEDHLLAGKLMMALSYPPLGVDSSGVGLRLLLLLVSLLLIGEELHS